MMRVYSGYATGYSPDRVEAAAHKVASMVRQAKANGVDTFVVHGNSGVPAGFAALMLEDFNLVLVRKDNDASHGAPIEGPDCHEFDKYMVIDDFVCTGGTIRRIVNKINTLSAQRGEVPPVCMGILCYGSPYRRTDRVTIDDADIDVTYGD